MISLSRFSTILLLVLMGVSSLYSQADYYQQLDDVSGFDTSPYQDELDSAAKKLVRAFPQEYQDSFRIYSVGVYIHNEEFNNSYTEILQMYKEKISNNNTPYYLLFVRESNETKIYDNISITFNLPDDINQLCLSSTDIENLNKRLEIIANNKLNIPTDFKNSEIQAMNSMKEYMKRTFLCCTLGGRSNRLNSSLDTSLLELEICIDNLCIDFEEYDNALISRAPNMPEISFRVNYYGDSLCTSLNAKLKITYKRTCKDNSVNRHRNDVMISQLDSIKLFNKYYFEYGDTTLFQNTKYSKSFSKKQGGKARIIITDMFDDKLKEFKFQIKGQNPKIVHVFHLIDKVPYNDSALWFMKKVALHESATDPNDPYLKHFNNYYKDSSNLYNGWDSWSRCPNLGPPCGWGIGQIDYPKPSKQALWDWKSNIHTMYWFFVDEKKRVVLNRLEDDLQILADWEDENGEIQPHVDINHGGIVWSHAMNGIFSDNELVKEEFEIISLESKKSFLSGCLLKAYNGLGDDPENFYYLKEAGSNARSIDTSPKWKIDSTASYEGNVNKYVKYIAEQILPSDE